MDVVTNQWPIVAVLFPILVLSLSASFGCVDRYYLKSGRGKWVAIKAGLCVTGVVLPVQFVLQNFLDMPPILGPLILAVVMGIVCDVFYPGLGAKKTAFVIGVYLLNVALVLMAALVSILLLPQTMALFG